MSETVSGTVEKINKNKGGFYGILIADTWFGGGKTPPTYSEGSTVQFEWKANGNFKNIIESTMEVLEPGKSTPGVHVPSAAKATTNWDLKDKRITRLACRKDAIALINILAEKDALTLPTKKNERQDAIIEQVAKLADDLYGEIYSSPFEVE